MNSPIIFKTFGEVLIVGDVRTNTIGFSKNGIKFSNYKVTRIHNNPVDIAINADLTDKEIVNYIGHLVSHMVKD